MNQRSLPVIALFLLVSISFSCKKGDTGLQGVPGSANVMYTDWFTPTPWTKDTVFSIWGYNYTQPVPAITQQILDSGVVLTFAKLLGYNVSIWPTTQVGQLPISLTYQSGSIMTDTWSARSSVGNVKIRFVNDHNYWSSISTSHQFRVVVIPGGIKSARVSQPTYESICKAYNIPE
ncbi:MAG: hypothetical protein QM802_23050 [Agriterribacter sp.]